MKFFFKWYDFYVGAYYDRDRGYLYLVFFMFGVRLSIKQTDYRRKQAERNLKYMELMGELALFQQRLHYADSFDKERLTLEADRLKKILKGLEDYRWTPSDLMDPACDKYKELLKSALAYHGSYGLEEIEPTWLTDTRKLFKE